jgi:hypothetical protein
MIDMPTAAPVRRHLPLVTISLAMLVSGCATGPGPRIETPDPPPIPQGGPPVPASNDAVLNPGEQIVAKTAAGRIKIEAGPGRRRIYTWDGLRRGAILKPRTQPFPGETGKGLYFNGKPAVWAPANGITRLDAEEGKRNFDNTSDAKIWMQIRRLYYTYNDHGLAVGWKRQGNTLHVELWQFTIDGKKPTQMPGADDAAIQTGPVHAVAQKMKPELVFADGHTEPYNTTTAQEYPNAHTGGSAGNTAGGSSGGWFQQHIVDPIKALFGNK